MRLAGDPRQAEEVTLEAFTAAWDGLADFRGDSRFSTWVCSITANLCRARIRERRRRGERFERLEPSASRADPKAVLHVEDRIDLERAIASLPHRARETIVLRHIQGFTLAEIAETMGVTIGTVKSQLSRACALMRERFSDE